MECFRCGSDDHLYRDCPEEGTIPATTPASAKPTWCGSCDEMTRLVYLATSARRCKLCHPLRGRELIQHRKCAACRQRVYTWDTAACGRHQNVAVG